MNNASLYMPCLDGLRCLAVMSVLLVHGSYGIFRGGWVGVDLFFVLSGYLITTLLLNEQASCGRIDLWKFYARRALRLLPALVAAICLAGMLWPLTPAEDPHSWLRVSAIVLAYGANLVPATWLGSLSHCWSLSVEEHFYLVWPLLLVMVLRRSGKSTLLTVALVLAMGSAVFRSVAFRLVESYGLNASLFTPMRIDTILIGAITAILPVWRPKTLALAEVVPALCIIVSFVLCLRVSQSNYLYLGGFDAIALLFAVLVYSASSPITSQLTAVGRLLSAPPLLWIGRRSYGIYLYHFPIFLALEVFRVRGSAANFLIVSFMRFILTFIAAALSYHFLEAPFLKIKSRLSRVVKTEPDPAPAEVGSNAVEPL